MPQNSNSFYRKKNIYLCPHCGHGYVTIDMDSGVTPFLNPCQQEDCHKLAQSLCYRAPQEMLSEIKPAYEWYRPSEEETAQLGPAMKEHVVRGGLLFRKAR